jgi:predicted enzyme related to lactoylglutathione lyase
VLSDAQGAVFALVHSASGDAPDELVAPGEWIWSSLHTSDADQAAGFYQNLFGSDIYELEASNDHLLMATEDYARATINGLPSNSHAHPHWINYVRVGDAQKMASKVVALGGRVLVKPHPDRHGGKVAIVADPTGAVFGLFEWADSERKEIRQ